jgi:hypothetical protein
LVEKETGIACENCGFVNPSGVKFCSNCGKNLAVVSIPTERFESLFLLNLAGSLYVLMSVLFNEVYSISPIFLTAFLAVSVLGLIAAYGFYSWSKIDSKKKLLIKVISGLTVVLGFSSTFFMFYLGLAVSGVIGPIWIIYVILGWRLWTDRQKL